MGEHLRLVEVAPQPLHDIFRILVVDVLVRNQRGQLPVVPVLDQGVSPTVLRAGETDDTLRAAFGFDMNIEGGQGLLMLVLCCLGSHLL